MKKIVALLLLPFLVTCTSSTKNVKSISDKSVVIFYNNDNFSFLDPCGCRVSPIGGIDRRWNGMMQVPEARRVFVDAGNLLFKSSSAAEYLAPQWFEQAAGVVEAYNLLKADAVTVGETDFALGVDKFLALRKKANFPFISSNIFYKNTHELFLDDHVIIERAGKKIGIFAVFHPSLKLPPELEATDPVKVSKKMVQQLKSSGVDFIIALSHQGYDYDKQLAEAAPGIDLIVGASSQSLLQHPDTVANTTIVQLSSQGQMLGSLEYNFSQKPALVNSTVVELNAEYNNNPTKDANPMKSLIAVTNLRMQEANRKIDEELWSKHKPIAGANYQTFLSCRDCHAKQAQFYEGTNHAGAFLTLMKVKKESNLDCVKCHSVGLGQENGFKSVGDAFRNAEGNVVKLEDIKAANHWTDNEWPNADHYSKNPASVRPDVARWISGLKKAGVTKSFAGVQCETCHEQRDGHPFADPAGAKHVAINSNLCIRCHTAERMPAWYANGKLDKAIVQQAIKKISCPR